MDLSPRVIDFLNVYAGFSAIGRLSCHHRGQEPTVFEFQPATSCRNPPQDAKWPVREGMGGEKKISAGSGVCA